MDRKYIVESLDQRDGGSHVIIVSMIDSRTGIKTRSKVATFEPECRRAADEYAAWMNGDAPATDTIDQIEAAFR